jgi:hypothetical protein
LRSFGGGKRLELLDDLSRAHFRKSILHKGTISNPIVRAVRCLGRAPQKFASSAVPAAST